MRILTTIAEMRSATEYLRAHASGAQHRDSQPTSRPTLGLVPTMGALHAGHLSLVAAAREHCDLTAASIFVNPLQFGPTEDLARYPRTFAEDCRQLEAAGVDLLFAPSPDEMTPSTTTTFVEVPGLSDRLDGASRPGHFRGVATIVAKLLHVVTPNLAFFGQKDAAQVAVLRRMIADLNLPVRLVVCPTVREPDGLALSSRNRYLSPTERRQALTLSHALRRAEQLVEAGERSSAILEAAMRTTFAEQPELRLDYAAVVDPDTLLPLVDIRRGALLAVAAYVGTTRLIDNLLLPETIPQTSEDQHA